jgi:hypothetical protein
MFRTRATRVLFALTTGLVLAAGPSAARAECDERVTCIGPISQLVSDPVTQNAFIRMKSGDEADLGCALSGPAVLGPTALRLARTSKTYYENYQIAIVAAVTTLAVRATVKNPSGVPGGICEIETLVFEPFF